MIRSARLDPCSLVPLYYQLYQVIKEEIDARTWAPGGQIPSEPELTRAFGVSRIVVRQALSILEDDGQVVRVRGRGTFVAPAKIRRRVGGLVRDLVQPRPDDVRILILDIKPEVARRSICARMRVAPSTDIVRVASLLSVRSVPVAIRYSLFAGEQAHQLAEVAQPGRVLPADFTLGQLGIRLAHSAVDLEVSDACKFEADRLETLFGSTVLVVSCTEYLYADEDVRPVERARVVYGGTAMRLFVDGSGQDEGGDGERATWEPAVLHDLVPVPVPEEL